MFRRPDPLPATNPAAPGATVPAGQPHDTCFRCGRPTPVGVSLCEHDNPARIKSPSSTQVHGTIVIGVLAGFLLLAVLLRLASLGVGPFTSTVVGAATRADGGLDIVVQVANGGSRASGASCRVVTTGAPAQSDYVFFTAPIPAGESRQFGQTVPPRPGVAALRAGSLAIRCT